MTKIKKYATGGKSPDREVNAVGDDSCELDRWEMDGGELGQITETDTKLTAQNMGLSHKRERRRPLKPIEVSFGLSGRNEPLVTFVKSPLAFCDLQLGPKQLRTIATTLMKIADDSEAIGQDPGEQRRSYPIG